MAFLADARALIISSTGYEAGPLILAEAFARGVPVIAPALGAFAEAVHDDETGRLFTPGDQKELAACVEHLRDDEVSLRMGSAAKDCYERSFTPERYLEALLTIYEWALARRAGRSPNIPALGISATAPRSQKTT
jgi:glycosyltransferase involved in cell wall biosynthesis